MRIVVVQYRFHPNTRGWVEGLQARGHEVRMLVWRGPAPSEDWTGVDVRIVPPMPRVSRLLARVLRVKAERDARVPRLRLLVHELRRARTDAVLLKQERLASVVVSLVALGLGVRRVMWSNHPEKFARRYGLWSLLLRGGVLPRRRFFTTTQHPGALGDPTARVSGAPFIPYAPVARQVRKADSDPRSGWPVRLLTIGRIGQERKRASWTLEAAQRAGVLDGRVTFTFVGTGDETRPGYRELARLAEKYGCADRLVAHFDVPHRDMSEIFAAHDLLVAPARDEPFGMVVVEAMAHGLAVICSDTAGAQSCVVPEETGLVFSSSSADDLAAKLRSLVDDPRRVQAMGQRGREVVEEFASPDVVARQIDALVRDRLPRRR